ncbi:hypothetical protein G6011_10110 [Alternaria panax]|uniref:F-box domain-containing protein n=1 Tax=Alternaria panax TaxID=48097 RepID=A0AAD4I6A4_9PLEO|nr:hypothetical protein G6011_10110 [Alternaria panax]
MATLSDPSPYLNFLISPRIPPELVLRTIQHLPFNDGTLITAIRSAHPRLRAIFKNYESSITSSFMRKELRHAETDFSCKSGSITVEWLADCVGKYDIVDDVMDALCSDYNFNAIPRHNMPLANAGILLLYRLASIDRLTYMTSLPRDPLTAMYLTLHHATLTARYHGSGWINQRTYGRFMDANQVSLRCELEFCFAEAALCLGPQFISDTLLHHDTSDAETTLLNFYVDHGTHDWEWPCWGGAKGG